MKKDRIFFTVVNELTGEPCEDCPVCGLYRIKTTDVDYEYAQQPVYKGHAIIEVTSDEYGELRGVETDELGRRMQANKIDLKKAKRHVKQRGKIRVTKQMHGISYEDTVPIKVVVPRSGGSINGNK